MLEYEGFIYKRVKCKRAGCAQYHIHLVEDDVPGWVCMENELLADELDEFRIKQAVNDADFEFWKVICKHFPEIETGDLDIGETLALTMAEERAVRAWYEANVGQKLYLGGE